MPSCGKNKINRFFVTMNNRVQSPTIGFYSPYLQILGGGERYFLSIASMLSKNHTVSIFSDPSIKGKAKSVFDISLERVRFLPESLWHKRNIIERFSLLNTFHIVFYMTDGSIFFPFSSKNFLIIQSPKHIPSTSVINSLKLSRWTTLCYSRFMRDIINEKLGIQAKILSPCVNTRVLGKSTSEKEHIILTVGRFFRHPHDKKLEILVEVFKNYYKKYFTGWKLIIAGGLTQEDGIEVLKNVRKATDGYPIQTVVNCSFQHIASLYAKASIYWHAAGFGEDLKVYPEKAEHFGITTLEAMAAGCVPVVFDSGGQKDIVTDSQNGYLWKTTDELARITGNLLRNSKILDTYSKAARERALDFSCDLFYEKVLQIISK